MGFMQRAEEKLFRWWKAIDRTRPGSLQDIHLRPTASQTSITLSVWKERHRLAKEVETQEQQERITHSKKTCNLSEDIFDKLISLKNSQEIAQEAKEAKDFVDIEPLNREVEDGCLNADDWSWGEVEWDEVEWDEGKWDEVKWDEEKLDGKK
ncbi:hypothetical protein BOTCAL_0739g00040 [Botryotinia calthae]|uniref:Uncharacterized protein n=1 Tax=Botryotinia calthae TaxID=38488 RepID=A0A4Y8CGH3_9HELO|nr:hypothetical protein BOTCAL_0739g00040 [Botryotinia calthae]